ncbi:MAG: hypothetical protein GXX78_11825 [Bacteroidales bacterium]|nr:hypothetical protein [Bacteroidales bacterium]
MFGKNEKSALYLLLSISALFILYACPLPCEPQRISVLPIPDSVSMLIPYKNGDTVNFQHSGGLVVPFVCQRDSSAEYAYSDWCSPGQEYRLDETLLIPDYPISSVFVQLTKYDEQNLLFSISVANSSTVLNALHELSFNLDSLKVNQKWFYCVMALNLSSSENPNYPNKLRFDSVYYTQQNGIVRLTMSNGEYYDLFEK